MTNPITSATRLLSESFRHPSAQGNPWLGLRAMGRVLWWQAVARTDRDFVFDWIDGAKLVAKRGISGATGNIYNGLDEFADMSFVLHFLRPGEQFFDIGANIGSYTILASGVCKANSVSFEPDPDTAKRLMRNIDENSMGERVTIEHLALADAPGVLRFTKGLSSTNHITTKSGPDTQEITASTLDLMRDRYGTPRLIKMDVEGGEESALTGGTQTLADPALKAVIIEDQSAPVVALLTAAGLTQCWYDVRNRRLSDQPTHGSFNGLFVRDVEEINKIVAQAPKRRFRGIEQRKAKGLGRFKSYLTACR